MADNSFFEQGGKTYKRFPGGENRELFYSAPIAPLPIAPLPQAGAYPEYTALPKPSLLPEPDINTMRGQFAAGLQNDLTKALRQGQDIYAGRGITGSGEETRYMGQAQEGFGRALAGQETNLMELLRGVKGQNIQTQNAYEQTGVQNKSAYDMAKFGQRRTDLTNIVNTLKDQAATAAPGTPIREQYNKAVSELLGLPYAPEVPGMQGTPGTSTIPGLPTPKPLEANNEALGRAATGFENVAKDITRWKDDHWDIVKDLPEDSPARKMYSEIGKDIDKLENLAAIIDNPSIEPTQKEIDDFMALIDKVGNMGALKNLSARIGAAKGVTRGEEAKLLSPTAGVFGEKIRRGY